MSVLRKKNNDKAIVNWHENKKSGRTKREFKIIVKLDEGLDEGKKIKNTKFKDDLDFNKKIVDTKDITEPYENSDCYTGKENNETSEKDANKSDDKEDPDWEPDHEFKSKNYGNSGCKHMYQKLMFLSKIKTKLSISRILK